MMHLLLFVLYSLPTLGYCRYSEGSKLDALAERFFQWRIKEYPEYGTKLGFHELDDKVQEYSEDAFSREWEQAGKFLNESLTIDYESLIEQDRVTLDVLRSNLQIFREGYQFRKFSMYNLITPMERPTDELEKFASQMKFDTEEDYQKYLTRLSQFPKQIQDKMRLMRIAIANKITDHRVSLTGAVNELNNKYLVSDVNSSILFLPFLKFPRSFSSQLKRNLSDKATHIIQQIIAPACLELRDFIENEYGPATRPNISVGSLPGGPEYYKACLKWHTSVDWSPEAIHEKGNQEVERITKLIDRLKDESGFRGSLREYIDHLNGQRENFYNTEQELHDGYETLIKEFHGRLNKVLYRIPRQKLIITKSSNPQARTARYRTPPLDESRPGEFVAKLDNPQTRPKYRMPPITLHEAEPGHHTQFCYTIDENLPTFRRAIEYRNYNAVPFNWPFYTGYVEGWALYAETLGEELGAYTDNKKLFGKYESELFRASRLVVDTGIHAFGWPKERAVNYLFNHSALSRDECEDEVNRYISWPGQACSYKIGEMTIKELRKNAEVKLGENFSLTKFHHQILKLGPVPLSVLKNRIEIWVAEGGINQSTRISSAPPALYFCIALSALLFSYRL